MMRVYDHYFAAWLINNGYEYQIDGKHIYIKISKVDCDIEMLSYEKYKPIFDSVRMIIKRLHAAATPA